MADTNGEKRRETLEERQARQEGASRDTAAAIEAKDESIAAKKAALEAKMAEFQKMLDEISEAEAALEVETQERDNLSKQKRAQDRSASLTGKLIGIKNMFAPVVNGFKGRLDNLRAARQESKAFKEEISSTASSARASIDGKFDEQRGATSNKLLGLRIGLNKTAADRRIFVTQNKAQTRRRFNALKTYFQALLKSPGKFSKYLTENMEAMRENAIEEFEAAEFLNDDAAQQTQKSVDADTEISSMQGEIDTRIDRKSWNQRMQSSKWRKREEAQAHSEHGKTVINGVHTRNLRAIEGNSKLAKFSLKARVALARVGAALGLNDKAVEYIDETARQKAEDRVSAKTTRTVARHKKFGEATVNFENSVIDWADNRAQARADRVAEREAEAQKREALRAERREKRAAEREARQTARQDARHNAQRAILEVLTGRRDPLRGIKDKIHDSLEGMYAKEVTYAKERGLIVENPVEAPEVKNDGPEK